MHSIGIWTLLVALAQSPANDAPPPNAASIATQAKPLTVNATGVPTERDTPAGPDTMAVCPAPLVAGLSDWLAYRRGQGHQVEVMVVDGGESAEQTRERIRGRIRAVARAGALRAVVLIGDAAPADNRDAGMRTRTIPAFFADAKVNTRWGSEPQIATDNWYADLDDDDVPDLAIGRLPADSPAELTALTRRIAAYEQTLDHGLWRQRVNFVAGVGGFGALVDSLLETATKKFLTDGIPTAYDTSMTYGSWRSPYCPDPRRFQQATLDRFNEGCLFWVYIGHGHPLQLDRVRLPNGTHPILTVNDLARLRAKHAPPIAVMLACYTGAFDFPRDCFAEEMVRAEGGPIAALCGSRVTMPYAMAVLAHGMLEEVFRQRRETLGEVLLRAKQRLVKNEPDDTHRQLLDALAATVSPSAKLLPDERREHLHLFNLLGDPLLRIRHPLPARVVIPEDVEAGQEVEISLESPTAGKATLQLVCRRDRLRVDLPARDDFESAAREFERFDVAYRFANDRRWLNEALDWRNPGVFRATLKIPEEAHGACHLTLHVDGRDHHALGAADLFVRKQRPKP
ncbi:MAG: C25 family cysteine peptidase [Planctomycetota bacterium]